MPARAVGLLVLVLLLAACGQPDAAVHTTAPTPVLPHAKPAPAMLTAVATLAPDAVLVQFDNRDVMGWHPSRNEPWGHVPPVTLLADGSLVYLDSTRGMVRVQLDTTETATLLAGVYAAGWDDVLAHANTCTFPSGCNPGADGGIQILRVRDAAGTLREVVDSGLAEDPTRQRFYQIAHGLYGYHDPRAQPYMPTQATLVVEPDRSGSRSAAPSWPLDRRWLVPLGNREVREVIGVLAGEDLRTMAAAVHPVTRRQSFVANGRGYTVELIPWLPGRDDGAAVARFAGCTFYAPPMAVTPTIYQTATPTQAPATATPTITLTPVRPPPATPTFVPDPYPYATYPPPTQQPAGCPP